jgi:hypothetical protein
MERIVLFLVLGAFLTGSMYAYNVQENAKDADAALWSYQYQELARDAALAGLDRTEAALARDAHAPWGSPGVYARGETPYGNGSYQVYVHGVGGSTDTMDVYVVGVHGPDTMRIEARYVRAMDDHETPPAFRAVMVADELELEGDDITVRSSASGRNASIHVNERLDNDAFDLDVHGYGTFSALGGDAFDVDDFLPNVDYNGAEPNVLQIPEIPVPSAQADSFSQHGVIPFTDPVFEFENTSGGVAFVSTDSLVAENCTSGDLPPASCQLGPNGRYIVGNSVPLIYYVYGSIILEDVQIQGNLVMYARGDGVTGGNPAITVRGVVQGDNVDGTGRLLLRSPEAIRIDKDGATRASVWSNTRIEITDAGSAGSLGTVTPGFVGTLLARDITFDLNSADDYDLTYLPPSPLVTAPGYQNDHPVGPRLIAYAEWDDIALP